MCRCVRKNKCLSFLLAVVRTILWRIYHPKRDESKRTVEDCHPFGWICLMVLCLIVVWGLLYMPLKMGPLVSLMVGSWETLPESLSRMVTQRDLSRYILPDNDTHLQLPRYPPCKGIVFVAVLVCSSVPNFNARQAIRNTWAQEATRLSSVRVFFLLGRSSNDALNALVANESLRHSDIVQQDFLDTYYNLTLKSVMLLKWVGQHCANAKYVMKTDDDMFVHLPNLFRLLKAQGHQRMLLGYRKKGHAPVRNRNSKWFVPDGMFPGRIYPPFLSGSGYVMSRDAVPLLYRTALGTPFFYLEDVFITGICAAWAGLKPVNNEDFYFLLFKRKNDYCMFRSVITAHEMTPKELVQVWNNLQNSSIKCKKP